MNKMVKLMVANGVKDVYVAIERNIQTIYLQWLNRDRYYGAPQVSAPSGAPAGPVQSFGAVPDWFRSFNTHATDKKNYKCYIEVWHKNQSTSRTLIANNSRKVEFIRIQNKFWIANKYISIFYIQISSIYDRIFYQCKTCKNEYFVGEINCFWTIWCKTNTH